MNQKAMTMPFGGCPENNPYHPPRYFDVSTVADIVADMAGVPTRQELVKFWERRRQCPICQAAIGYDASSFSQCCGEFYTRLARFDDVFNTDDWHQVVTWSQRLYAAKALSVAGSDTTSLDGNPPMKEISKLIALMLTPFDYDEAVRDLIRQSVPAWVAKKTWRQEWDNVLTHAKTKQALQALANDENLFRGFFSGFSEAETSEGDVAGVFVTDTARLHAITNSHHVALAMGAELLLRFRTNE